MPSPTNRHATRGGGPMSVKLDKQLNKSGTRFRLFAQARYLPSFQNPETIAISVPPKQMQPGPADSRIYTIDAINKKPYGPNGAQPQWQGASNPPVKPGADGHF